MILLSIRKLGTKSPLYLSAKRQCGTATPRASGFRQRPCKVCDGKKYGEVVYFGPTWKMHENPQICHVQNQKADSYEWKQKWINIWSKLVVKTWVALHQEPQPLIDQEKKGGMGSPFLTKRQYLGRFFSGWHTWYPALLAIGISGPGHLPKDFVEGHPLGKPMGAW